MRVKKVRRMCMVKGCRNIGCYTLTAGREFGNSVIICGDCLKKANEEVEKMQNLECGGQNEETAELVEEPAVEEVMQEPDAESTDEVEAEDVIESDAPAGEEEVAESVADAEVEPAEEKKSAPQKKPAAKKTTAKKGAKK